MSLTTYHQLKEKPCMSKCHVFNLSSSNSPLQSNLFVNKLKTNIITIRQLMYIYSARMCNTATSKGQTAGEIDTFYYYFANWLFTWGLLQCNIIPTFPGNNSKGFCKWSQRRHNLQQWQVYSVTKLGRTSHRITFQRLTHEKSNSPIYLTIFYDFKK